MYKTNLNLIPFFYFSALTCDLFEARTQICNYLRKILTWVSNF